MPFLYTVFSSISVSYTHLDVYKRQLLFREQTILENLTEVIAATKEKLAVYEAYENKKQ